MAEEIQEIEDKQVVPMDDFLKENVDTAPITKDIKLDRFKSPFRVKALTADEVNELRKDASTITFNKRTHAKTTQMDSEKYSDLMIAKAVITPDLNNAQLQESWGRVADPAGTLRAMLYAGESKQITDAISELAGMNQDNLDEEVDEVKK
ncbi:hypothetical protein MOO46_07700 (plasmid) [Apilactobacillus apisilvae]|uniref:Phage XkdN-like protein n=1 Tax=Apilactobacillus apisilvae TaxID=2923364 RepID=A0ABY4PKJ4_9LACO|nr:hypothetical protein [Apilactobacillus apisilvae]UQS85866.1 hypothetical protein MOO46_07700 [Apilactobacillus apisilvae]